MKRFLSIALSLALALSLLAGCGGGGSSAAPASGGAASTGASTPAEATGGAMTQFPREESLYYFSGMGTLPTSFNPMAGTPNWPAGQMQYMLYEAMFMMDMLTGELEPLLADSYEIQDNDSIKVALNAKAHFNDGTPLTSEDVKFSYDVAQEYDLTWSTFWQQIESVEAVDAQTLVFHQKADAVNTPVVLDSFQMVPIMPKAVWGPVVEGAAGDVSAIRSVDNLQAPVGSGPYKVHSFNDQGIYLERDDNYWGVERFGKLPAPKYVIQPIYKSNDLVTTDFQNNKLDLVQAYIPKIWESKEKNPAIKTYLADAPYHLTGGMVAIVFNTTLPGLDAAAVRRALAYGINYEQVAQLAVSGYSDKITPMMCLPDGVEDKYVDQDALSELMWGYDPDEANRLLDEMGAAKGADGIRVLPDGTRMSWSLQTGYGWTDWNAAAEVICQNLKAIGVELVSDMPESAVFSSNKQTGKFEITMNIMGENPRPSQPWFRYKDFLYSVGVPPVGEMTFANFGRYNSDRANAIIEQLPGVTDEAELKKLHTEINKIFLEDAPAIPIMYRPFQFYEVNETYWTNFPTADNGSDVPPMLDRGAGMKLFYEVEPAAK